MSISPAQLSARAHVFIPQREAHAHNRDESHDEKQHIRARNILLAAAQRGPLHIAGDEYLIAASYMRKPQNKFVPPLFTFCVSLREPSHKPSGRDENTK